MTLHVAWIADTERVEAMDAPNGLLVLPDAEDVHRVYWYAKDASTLAQLCALPLALALDTGVFSLACKIVRDNPGTGAYRGVVPGAPPAQAWPVSEAARIRIEALITAVAAGARATDGSHVRALLSARDAVLDYVGSLERGA